MLSDMNTAAAVVLAACVIFATGRGKRSPRNVGGLPWLYSAGPPLTRTHTQGERKTRMAVRMAVLPVVVSIRLRQWYRLRREPCRLPETPPARLRAPHFSTFGGCDPGGIRLASWASVGCEIEVQMDCDCARARTGTGSLAKALQHSTITSPAIRGHNLLPTTNSPIVFWSKDESGYGSHGVVV